MSDPIATTRAEADATVTAAEEEATEAASLAAALEERVRNGDDTVTPEQIASARELGHFAQLRAEATRRKADEAKRAARLAECEQLRKEIETYANGSGQHFVELLKTADNAIHAFVDAILERNEQIEAWRARMYELHIPNHNNPLIPPKEHGHLGLGARDSSVIGGRRRMAPTDPQRWIGRMLCLVVHTTPTLRHIEAPSSRFGDREHVYDDLAKLDKPISQEKAYN